MRAVLNIGLARTGLPDLTIEDVVRELHWVQLEIVDLRTIKSDTEQTAVVTVLGPVRLVAHTLSKLLQQDCIAVYQDSIDFGELIGPGAEKWGEFDPRFFLLPNGQRLSETVATA